VVGSRWMLGGYVFVVLVVVRLVVFLLLWCRMLVVFGDV